MYGFTGFWVLEFGEFEFSIVLEFHKKFYSKFEGYFFKELEYHRKLEFPKLEYSKSSRFLHFFKIVVD